LQRCGRFGVARLPDRRRNRFRPRIGAFYLRFRALHALPVPALVDSTRVADPAGNYLLL
jgi:hypothetical protein